MCPGAGDTAKRWCGGSWKVWGEHGVTMQHAPWGQSTDGAAPSSSCSVPGAPLKKFSCTSKCPQPGHKVGVVAERGKAASPEGPPRWLVQAVSHLASALSGSASLNIAPVTSSSRAKGDCGGSGEDQELRLCSMVWNRLPHPVLDVSANSQPSAGDCVPSPKVRLSGQLAVGLSRSGCGLQRAGRGVWYVVLW